VIVIKTKGTYSDLGLIELETERVLLWSDLTNESPPDIPFGTSLEISVSFQENDFLSGKSGVVWATYNSRQAEVIQGALVAQQIGAEVKSFRLGNKTILILIVKTESDVNDAIDFIWRSKNGLRLKPDWSYREEESNTSFEQWLNGQ
jgi:hypothetical protein